MNSARRPFLIVKPSERHGVGVFTTRHIRAGEVLPLFARGDYVFTRSESTWPWGRFHCYATRGYWRPRNFHRMSIGWYLNRGKPANVRPSREGVRWTAVRSIRAGAELLLDYRDVDYRKKERQR